MHNHDTIDVFKSAETKGTLEHMQELWLRAEHAFTSAELLYKLINDKLQICCKQQPIVLERVCTSNRIVAIKIVFTLWQSAGVFESRILPLEKANPCPR